jgi:hypothetical protein|tara:strand:+ start:758 stop:1069 length:312 start_codon:yes stop_codon:yes gene_type:complete
MFDSHTQGTTPFEKAEAQRSRGDKRLITGIATNRLIKLLEEADIMIDMYKNAAGIYHSFPTETNRQVMEDTLELATEALKDKKSAEAALEEVAKMAEQLGFQE